MCETCSSAIGEYIRDRLIALEMENSNLRSKLSKQQGEPAPDAIRGVLDGVYRRAAATVILAGDSSSIDPIEVLGIIRDEAGKAIGELS